MIVHPGTQWFSEGLRDSALSESTRLTRVAHGA